MASYRAIKIASISNDNPCKVPLIRSTKVAGSSDAKFCGVCKRFITGSRYFHCPLHPYSKEIVCPDCYIDFAQEKKQMLNEKDTETQDFDAATGAPITVIRDCVVTTQCQPAGFVPKSLISAVDSQVKTISTVQSKPIVETPQKSIDVEDVELKNMSFCEKVRLNANGLLLSLKHANSVPVVATKSATSGSAGVATASAASAARASTNVPKKL